MIFTSGLPLAVHSRVAESYWLTITDLEGQGEFHKGTVDIYITSYHIIWEWFTEQALSKSWHWLDYISLRDLFIV